METESLVAPVLTGRFFTTESPGKPKCIYRRYKIISQMPLQLIFWIYFGYSNSINLNLNYWNREVGVETSLVLTQMRGKKKKKTQLGQLCFMILSFLIFFSFFFYSGAYDHGRGSFIWK